MSQNPVAPDEFAAFGTTPPSSSVVLLRVWDDRANVPDAAAATLPVFCSLFASLARCSP